MLYDFGSRSKAFKDGIQFEVDDDFKYKGYSFSLTTNGYVRFSGRKDGLNMKLLHRMLMNEPVGLDIDHIDGNKSNNCLSNLRVATNTQNLQNRGKTKKNTSGFKGVCWNEERQKWKAEIIVEGKTKFLGRFLNAEDAYRAYCEACFKYHGEFAHI